MPVDVARLEPGVYVYFVRGSNTGNVKVGISTNVAGRFASYKTNCSEPVELIGAAQVGDVATARFWESQILNRFLFLSHGEWVRDRSGKFAAVVPGLCWTIETMEVSRGWNWITQNPDCTFEKWFDERWDAERSYAR